MRIYLDTEFTGLQLPTSLISIGIVDDDGREFYAELTDYNRDQINPWLQANVIDNLLGLEPLGKPNASLALPAGFYCGNRQRISADLRTWLALYDSVEVWSDCLAYDWVLFCDLFGGALNLPSNIYYIPFDLSTAFRIRGIDPDVSREAFSEMHSHKHNAIDDARVIRACVQKLGL